MAKPRSGDWNSLHCGSLAGAGCVVGWSSAATGETAANSSSEAKVKLLIDIALPFVDYRPIRPS
jgi:hypothetical protein